MFDNMAIKWGANPTFFLESWKRKYVHVNNGYIVWKEVRGIAILIIEMESLSFIPVKLFPWDGHVYYTGICK